MKRETLILHGMSNTNTCDDDGWLEDDTESPSHSDLHREWNARRREFSTSGVRDGYEAGKEESVQDGFNHGMSLYSSWHALEIDKMHGMSVGYALGATAGYEWGLLKGAAAAAHVNSQQHSLVTEDNENARLIEYAHGLLEGLDQNDIKKQECGSLWEEHGEMKDRFPERESPAVVAQASRRQGEMKSKAVSALENAGIRIEFNTH